MSLTFAAITPHSPILIPAIGKDNTGRLKDTVTSFAKISQMIIETNTDTLIIISPHGQQNNSAFVLNLHPKYQIGFANFGDLSSGLYLKGNLTLAYKIRERLETKTNLQLISSESLDYGSGIPLFMLLEKLPKIKIIPLYISGLTLNEHFTFGKLLQREIIFSKNKIGVIASGDLSHTLTKNAPAKFSPKAKKFDNRVIEFLQKKQTDEIIKLDENIRNEVGECGIKPISLLLGILEGINYKPKKLSYEYPFGIGYLTMSYSL
jgi:aromatic ring-opening dioxygenase LigB subunit